MDDESAPYCLNCCTTWPTPRSLHCHWARRSDCQRRHYQLERQQSLQSQYSTANHMPDPPMDTTQGNSSDDPFPEADSLPEEGEVIDPNKPHGRLLQKHQKHITSWNEHGPLPESLVPKVELILLLDKINAPLYAFKEFMEWGAKLSSTSIQSGLKRPPLTREAVLDTLCHRYNLMGSQPIRKKVTLPKSKVEVEIVTHDFLECLYSLLTDRELMKDENLLVLPTGDGSHSPFGTPGPQTATTLLQDITDGSVYRKAFKVHVQVPGRDVLVPIILFVDKTFCDVNGRLTLEPVSMTLGIFKKEVRRQPQAWRSLGYVPNTTIFRSNSSAADKASDYHFILTNILDSYRQAQKFPGIAWQLTFRGERRNICLKIPLLLVLGDTEGHDKLCGKYQNRTKAACLCRYCDCPTAETGNPRAAFEHTLGPYIQELADTALNHPSAEERESAKDELKNLSYHVLPSAFLDIVFCDKKRGINGATVAELLHVIQHGLFLYHNVCLFGARQYSKKDQSSKRKATALEEQSEPGFATAANNNLPEELAAECPGSEPPLDERSAPSHNSTEQLLQEFEAALPAADEESRQAVFTPRVRDNIDRWAKTLGLCLVHQSTNDYKDAFFPGGITQNAKKNGHEERNVVLILLLIFCSKQGEDLLDERLGAKRLANFVLVESLLLLIENFYRTPSFPKSFVSVLRNFMPCFLEYYATALNRQQGMKMNFVKFHLPLHLADDLERFGPSPSTDSSYGESHHKVHKSNAQRTQRTLETFEYQVAARHHESHILRRATQDMSVVPEVVVAHCDHRVTPKGRHFIVNREGMFDQRTRPHTLATWPDSVLQKQVTAYLQEHIIDNTATHSVEIVGRCKVGQILYHAQPCHKGRPWHDWVHVHWPCWGDEPIPALIVAFVALQLHRGAWVSDPNVEGQLFEKSGMYALVHALPESLHEHAIEEGAVRAHLSTRLVYKSSIAMKSDKSNQPQLYLVHVESMFKGPIAAVPYNIEDPNGAEWLFLEPRENWNNIFLDWMKELMK